MIVNIPDLNIQLIKWRLYNDGATSFSDEEIERIMRYTCSPTMNVLRAKFLRDSGILVYDKGLAIDVNSICE